MSIDTIVYDKNTKVSGIALIDDGIVKDIEIIGQNQILAGNVYLGKITKKISLAMGGEGFFVNIGENKDGLLNCEEGDSRLIEGQSVVVQVVQESHAEKHAKVVRSVQLPGKYLVYCPYRMEVKVSNKIEDKSQIEELIETVKQNTAQEGWVMRTVCVSATPEEIKAEMDELRAKYEEIRLKARNSHAPEILYRESDSVVNYINAYAARGSLQKIVTNDHNLEKQIEKLNLEVVISQSPFEDCGVDEVIGEALEKTIVLKSGGRITIEETKACVAIDVDSGGAFSYGHINSLNEEAATEIARQIRLRNLSGRIVIDFAGRSEYRYIKPLLGILEEGLQDDLNKSRIIGLSHGGLVEIIRVRRRASLLEIMSRECKHCHGTGRVEKDG
ncbi:MAG: ribonuclease E/G [Alphaproteobacteria bacterium]|nr:ribonuclease E/G [Alphaproteobacteria bacterium]